MLLAELWTPWLIRLERASAWLRWLRSEHEEHQREKGRLSALVVTKHKDRYYTRLHDKLCIRRTLLYFVS